MEYLAIALQVAATVVSIGEPTLLTADAAANTPTAAGRAISMVGVAPPQSPVRFRFQCLTSREGRLYDCIFANDGGTRDPAEFLKRLLAERDEADPLRRAARERLNYWRAPEQLDGQTSFKRSVFVDEIVSLSDVAPVEPGVPIKPGDLTVKSGNAEISKFYPAAAVRAEAQVQMTATCRVMYDLSLWCRNAKAVALSTEGPPPAWRQPSFDHAFAQASERAFATMQAASELKSGGTSVGGELELSINWLIPR